MPFVWKISVTLTDAAAQHPNARFVAGQAFGGRDTTVVRPLLYVGRWGNTYASSFAVRSWRRERRSPRARREHSGSKTHSGHSARDHRRRRGTRTARYPADRHSCGENGRECRSLIRRSFDSDRGPFGRSGTVRELPERACTAAPGCRSPRFGDGCGSFRDPGGRPWPATPDCCGSRRR
jgi:hypothetical protein